MPRERYQIAAAVVLLFRLLGSSIVCNSDKISQFGHVLSLIVENTVHLRRRA